ncbi:hypothetical protein [Cystobacter fuscus]|uniref:hypothetical protein n=1 Tax=Cystobacter fuscus TaxID=43 RepID=UPI0037BF2DC2
MQHPTNVVFLDTVSLYNIVRRARLGDPERLVWFDREYTLEELVEDIYGMTLEAWCPGGPASVREQLARTVERMSRATREDCMEAVLRVIPALVKVDTEFKHREELSDLGLLRERLGALRPEDFEDISSAWKYTVTMQLAAWDRALGRH